MRSNSTDVQSDPLKARFLFLACELSRHFPELDLHFNLEPDSGMFRYFAAAIDSDIFEHSLSQADVKSVLYDATFTLKQATGRFDA